MEDQQQMRETVEVGYHNQVAHPMLKIIRCVGVLAVIYGSMGLALLPIYTLYRDATRQGKSTLETWFGIINEWLGVWMALVLNVGLITCGIGFLRRKPKCRGLMVKWAWISLIWMGYVFVVTARLRHLSLD